MTDQRRSEFPHIRLLNLRCPTVIIKRHHPFGGPRQVGDNKADAGAQLAGVPFHLGHHAPLPVPTSSLIPEAGVIAPHMVRRTTDGAGQQVGNAFLKNLVLRQPDRVEKTLTFQELVDVRVNGGAKLVHPGGAKLVHLTLCGTRCWGVVPVVHRRDPRCFE